MLPENFIILFKSEHNRLSVKAIKLKARSTKANIRTYKHLEIPEMT